MLDLTDKANILWQDACLLLQNERYNSAASRFYYSVFIALINSLIAKGDLPEDDWTDWKTRRRGEGVHAFAKKNVGTPYPERRRLFDKLYDLRIRADYREQTVTREDIHKHVNEANKLLDNYLDEASQAFDAV